MEANKTYRIRTDVGVNDYISIDANLVQDYDTFEILSVSLDSVDTYKLHNSNYGVVVGRVIANNGFGIPNAKISIFIQSDSDDNVEIRKIYPFTSTASKSDGVRYNLLPDEKVADCHQIVGTFPNKRYALDNDVILEVFDKYYKYTTRTNNAGDYLICGIPTGAHTLHMDLDLSDCGILSQRPRDFVYKGYTIEQFENPNMFKEGTEYSSLSQVFTQDQVVNVVPFWGNESLGETIGITRADINVAFKFEPTCVFLGSVASDNASQGISKKCIPTPHMGDMDELTTGEGTIEMIRKTAGGSVEEFQVKGTQLINENGIWCYQIPMNLDYMMTDEYGNMVPTDNPDKGIPTRARVRFRISMQDNEENTDNYFRAKALVPHNPQNLENGKHEDYDYEFGTFTREDSYRDLFWNNVYSVKSYIPRFQKRRISGWKEDKFTGIKHCNYYGANNPIPYNNLRIKLPFMFIVMCIIIKLFIRVTSLVNWLLVAIANILADIGNTCIGFEGVEIFGWKLYWYPFEHLYDKALEMKLNVIDEGMCPDLENWYFAPVFRENSLWNFDQKAPGNKKKFDILAQTLHSILGDSEDENANSPETDTQSIDYINGAQKSSTQKEKAPEDYDGEATCLTIKTDYLISCIEMNLAQEYRVINFDFYNDWINGLIYFPRWMRYLRPKKKFLGITWARAKIMGCMDDTKTFSKARTYTQLCSLPYEVPKTENVQSYSLVKTSVKNILKNKMHKSTGFSKQPIFGKNGGICHEHTTKKGQFVYYLKPCEWVSSSIQNSKVNLFATDIILLGSLNDCDLNGIPQAFRHLSSSSYIMPTNLALTNMDTNGPLYAIDGKSICAGGSEIGHNENDIKNTRLSTVDIEKTGLTAELEYYRAAGENSSYNTNVFEEDEPADTIAMTEAAGISWNWTGPGQGTVNTGKMYYPGGHFLGLSCINSETNIKSCINLSRICEAGATMSQRKEDPKKILSGGTFEYIYTVPSGFISGDEIIDTNFRTMFATMNQNRLIATKTSSETGYKTYNFAYLRPSNFNGAFKAVVGDNGGPYNNKITVEEESNLLKKIANVLSGNKRDDYDGAETGNTQTRTIEAHNADYFMFRFGLDYEQLKKNDQMQKRKFLIDSNSALYLPQYENSYYFYFGMKYGATAIDEFNKQFFSKCDSTSLITGQSAINLIVDNFNFCLGTGDVNIVTENLENTFEYVKYYRKSNPAEMFEITGSSLEQSIIQVKDLKFDTWVFSIRDANGTEVTKSIGIGADLASADIKIYDFNTSSETRKYGGGDYYEGGYFKISNIKFNLPVDGFSGIKVKAVPISGGQDNNAFQNIPFNEEHKLTLDECAVWVTSANTQYCIYIELINSTGCSNINIPLRNAIFKNTASVQLMIGNKNKPNVSYLEDIAKKNLPMAVSNGIPKWLEQSELEKNEMWIYREAFFKTNSDTENGHDNLFYTNGASKVVFGTPQNSSGFIEDATLYSSNDEIPIGYQLDDENIACPTYGNGKIYPLSIMAYNGSIVCGDYIATIDGGGGVEYLPGEESKISKNTGCIYKDIENNELYFGSYSNHPTNIERGVVFPTLAFATISRPFNVEANFIEWTNKIIDTVEDNDGVKNYSIVDKIEKCKTEAKICNGITYDGRFAIESYITGYPEGKAIPTVEKDMYGIDKGFDRITSVSALTIDSSITVYKYNIIDGYPSDCPPGTTAKDYYSPLIHNLSKSAEPIFADSLFFSTNGDFTITTGGNTSEDSNIKYYYCENQNGLLGEEEYIYKEVSKNQYFVACTFTNDAGEYNKEGSTVIVRIAIFGNLIVEYSFEYKDESGNNAKYTSSKSNSNTTIDTAISEMKEFTKMVEPIRQRKLHTDNKNWVQSIIDDTYNGMFNKEDFNADSKVDENGNINRVDPASKDWYIVGVYEEDGLRVMRIYRTVTEIKEVSIPVAGGIGVNGKSAYNIVSKSNTSELFENVTITCLNGYTWTAVKTGLNVSIKPDTNSDTKNGETNAVVSWKDNGEYEETITLKYTDMEDKSTEKNATITVKRVIVKGEEEEEKPEPEETDTEESEG